MKEKFLANANMIKMAYGNDDISHVRFTANNESPARRTKITKSIHQIYTSKVLVGCH